jgi:hypothetical protein
MEQLQIISILFSLMLLVYILRIIRNQRLKEEYSLLWLAISIVFLVFSAWRQGLEKLADLLGIAIHNSYKRPRVDKATWAKVLPTLRKSGMTYKQIAGQIGATPISVCRWFLNQGIVTNNHYRD